MKNKKTSVAYFQDARDEIASENLHGMQIVNFYGTFITLILLFITPHIIPTWKMTSQYYFLIPHQLLFFSLSTILLKKGKKVSAFLVESMCAMYFVLLAVIFIAISVYPYPDSPQIFITLLFFIMPTIFIQSPWVISILTLGTEVAFILLAIFHKSPDALSQDIFNSVASIFFASIVTMMTTKLRVKDYQTRMNVKTLGVSDRLTKLLNRGAFEGECCFYMENSLPGKHCALLVIDFDDFKSINDTFGHPCGDEVLKHFAVILRDYFPAPSILGRIGGDEFAVFIKSSAGMKDLKNRIEHLQKDLKPILYNGTPVVYTCSIGAVTTSTHASFDTMYRLADTALYNVKETEKGKNRIAMC